MAARCQTSSCTRLVCRIFAEDLGQCDRHPQTETPPDLGSQEPNRGILFSKIVVAGTRHHGRDGSGARRVEERRLLPQAQAGSAAGAHGGACCVFARTVRFPYVWRGVCVCVSSLCVDIHDGAQASFTGAVLSGCAALFMIFLVIAEFRSVFTCGCILGVRVIWIM